jgi:regulator of protease activity HflC (stomatin/prohibitin superfamily)
VTFQTAAEANRQKTLANAEAEAAKARADGNAEAEKLRAAGSAKGKMSEADGDAYSERTVAAHRQTPSMRGRRPSTMATRH